MKNTQNLRFISGWKSLKKVIDSFDYKSVSNSSEKETSHIKVAEYENPDQEIIVSTSNFSDRVDHEERPYPHNYPRIEESRNDRLQGNPWRIGFASRFPIVSFFCLLIIIASTVALIIVLVVSDGHSVDSWDVGKVKIAGHEKILKFSVNSWIATFNFIMGKALAVMFCEGVAISWWVDALRGQTLQQLHFHWEVGQSVFKIVSRRKFLGWICVASIACAAFGGLELLLQTASTVAIMPSTYHVNMTAKLANALPAGFSGVIAASGHDMYRTSYLTPPFVQILQNYTVQSDIYLEVDGCSTQLNTWCGTTLQGVGFHYLCTANRSALLQPINNASSVLQPSNTVFSVEFNEENWAITLNALWQDTPISNWRNTNISDLLLVANTNCTLLPALVEYPVNITQGIVTLQPSTSTIEWTANSIEPEDSLQVDKVLQILPILGYDTNISTLSNEAFPGAHSTTGGISLAFSQLFNSEINLTSDITNANNGVDLSVQGAFAAPYAQFNSTYEFSYLDNTYASPMSQLLSSIRDIMFRSSVAIAQLQITDYILNIEYAGGSYSPYSDTPSSTVPAQSITTLGEYTIYQTVYQIDKVTLGIGVWLIVVAVLAILPLYWGFWRMGRPMSMSPLEIAKALHSSTILNVENDSTDVYDDETVKDQSKRWTNFGSNFTQEELMELVGHKQVKYGEVAPNRLGMGLSKNTKNARNGWIYY